MVSVPTNSLLLFDSWLLYNLTKVVLRIYTPIFFWGSISCILKWPCIHDVAEDDFELLSLMPPCLIGRINGSMGTNRELPGMLGKHLSNGHLFPNSLYSISFQNFQDSKSENHVIFVQMELFKKCFYWGCFYQRQYLIFILIGLLCHSAHVYNAFQPYSSLATHFCYLPSPTDFFLFLNGHLRHFPSSFIWCFNEFI